MEKPICGDCGNDGSKGGLFLTIDAQWRPDLGAWELQAREDDGGAELDCLACDHRTADDPGDSAFPYGLLIRRDGKIGKIGPVPGAAS